MMLFFQEELKQRLSMLPIVSDVSSESVSLYPNPMRSNGYAPFNLSEHKIVYPTLSMQPPENYPVYRNLLDVVTEWNPDIPDIPAVFTETLMHFNYSNPVERAAAEKYRDAELPFKVYDVPDIDEVTNKWTDEYLIEKMSTKLRVEKSEDNHFMYFKSAGRKKIKGWEPPQEVLSQSFTAWLQKAHSADSKKLGADKEHFYLTVGTGSPHDKKFFSHGMYT